MRHFTRCLALLLVALPIVAGCPSSFGQATEDDLKNIPKVDFHTHYSYASDYLVPLLEAWNMKAVVVDVVTDPARERWQAMKAHYEQEPEHLILCTSFDASAIDEPDFAEKVIAGLKEDFAAGAQMVKVWKNIGMVHKDASGQFIQIDDERFQPIWDFLVEEDVPVLAHIGEPRAAWLPLDENSPHYFYYSLYPQYHAYNDPSIPPWEDIMAARDRWLERNPDLTVVGAHLGSMAHDVGEVARRLNQYPNFYVETVARFGDLATQDSDKVREFFIKYQDRVLYGTDLLTVGPGAEITEAQREELRTGTVNALPLHWRYLTGSGELHYKDPWGSFNTTTRALALPREVIEKVYHDNAARILDLE